MVRRARLGDLDILVALEARFPSDRLDRRGFRHLLTRARADVWVYEYAGRVCGNVVVLYRRGSRCARIYSIVVDARSGGLGIGTALLKTAETGARRRGCREMRLEVRPRNGHARRLYQRSGYAVIKRVPDYYEDGGPALRLRKPLAIARSRKISP